MDHFAGRVSAAGSFSLSHFLSHVAAALIFTIFVSACVVAQQKPERDPSAIMFLSQAVSAAGGRDNLGSIQDFTATGQITHYWHNKPEVGQLTVKAKGARQFRLDSNVSEGTWSLIVNGGVGEVVTPGGRLTQLPRQNTLNSGSLTLPILELNAALQDETTTVIDKGLIQLGNGQAHQIHVQKNPKGDPTGIFSRLSQRDYFFVPSSLALVRVQDFKHPDNDAVDGALTHVLDFGSFRAVNGVLVPFSVSEKIAGQQTFQIQLNSIEFNTGLSDSDFQF